MAVLVANSVLVFLLLLGMAAEHSDGAYCVCSSGGDGSYQKNIDYACFAGADCTAILQNGACFNPNTVRDHCNYAVNSYFQKKAQIPGSCNFSGTATLSATAPPNVVSGCVYPSSSSGGSTTPAIGGGQPGSTLGPGFGPPSGNGFSPDGSAATCTTLVSRWMTSCTLMLFLAF